MRSNKLSRRSALATMSAGLVSTSLMSQADAFAAAASDLPDDVRLGALKDLNGYFPFEPSASIAEWEIRREYILRQMRVACGLWPMPERPQIEATIHGRVQRDGYTVDRVFFESSPGLLVTGSLYKPTDRDGKLPTVLCPYGHWSNGRFHDHGEQGITKELESGAEKFSVSGRYPLQARCVQLARMGCLVFHYDMQGAADGGSFTHELIHRFAKQREHLSSPERWGLFSAQAELRCLNALGIQTWNSIRAVDWLTGRTDCDNSRIAVTGASGGGTQTFMLAALDERIAAAFPAVMVSTAMQGGCTCENASYLRIGTGNIEFAAVTGPRPIFMSGANDWTREIETKGLPELKRHFKMLGVPDNVNAKHFDFPHNYNSHSRLMMYRFFNEHLSLGVDEIIEQDFVPLTVKELTVFDSEHSAPAKSEESEVAVLKAMDAASNKQMAALAPRDSASLSQFRHVVGGALEIMIGRSIPADGDLEYERLTQENHDGVTYLVARVRNPSRGEELPVFFLSPDEWNHQVVIWIDGEGKSRTLDASGRPIGALTDLLNRGFAIASADLLHTGDYSPNGQPIERAPIVQNPREFAGYTLGYNHPLLAQRTHDVMTLLSFVAHHQLAPTKLHIAGVNGAAFECLAATALNRDLVSSLAVDTRGYRFGSITDIRDVNLLPGAVKYGDLPAFLALCAPVPLAVVGETTGSLGVARKAYQVEQRPVEFLPSGASAEAIAGWIPSQK
jgi:Abhydrolase family